MKKNRIIIIILLLILCASLNITSRQLISLTTKSHETKRTEYKFFLEQHEGLKDYEPATGMVFPTKGYVLNIEETNSRCSSGEALPQNADKSVKFLLQYSTICNLYYDIKPENKLTLEKLQELSGQWALKSGDPDYSKASPVVSFTDNNFDGPQLSTRLVNANYLTYATSYTFDQETGKYSLVNPQHCAVTNTICRNLIETNYYFVDLVGIPSNENMSYTNLDSIIKSVEGHGTWTGTYTFDYLDSSKTKNSDTSEVGIWSTTDDYGTSYYVRGNYNYSYVKFANFYWRVVRINGDGSLRLIYDGTIAHDSGEVSSNRYLPAKKFNEQTNDNAYLGFMFGAPGASSYAQAHANINSSYIKQYLDSWYQSSLSGYSGYIADSIFCNDRSIDTLGNESSNTKHGYGTESTQYSPRYRIYSTKTPSLECTQKSDRFTVNDTSNGNGALTSPIGLINADEAAMAGTVYNKYSLDNYLTRGSWFWTMSPSYYGSGVAGLFDIYEDGKINVNSASYEPNVVPVINLTVEAVQQFEGTGTKTDPFRIKGEAPSANSNIKVKTLAKLQSLNPSITVNSSTPNFASSATSDEGLFAAEDDYGTSYYWRGAATTNYIKFGDWYWRIIRINGDDSLRLFYDGTSPGAKQYLRTRSFNPYSSNAYVGYMTGRVNVSTYADTHANNGDSNAKAVIDEWYVNNIKNQSFETYIADNIFCGDRTPASGTGIGTTTTTYKGYDRLHNNKTPSLKCNQKNDRFTVSDTTNGNGALTYAAGLITADEIVMAGAVQGTTNRYIYLNHGYDYWTMTPSGYYSSSDNSPYANVEYSNDGTIYRSTTNEVRHVVPVINIKSSALTNLTGSGTQSDPFIVH